MSRSAEIARSRAFVRSARLPRPGVERGATDAATADADLEAGKAQAAAIGPDVVSFATKVAPQRRRDVFDRSLRAQLWAKSKVADARRIFGRHDAYFGAPRRLGRPVQDQGSAVYVGASQNFSAHEAVRMVAEGLPMPAAGSVALIKTTLEALQAMDASSPRVPLCDRASRQASAARFQISLAEQRADGGRRWRRWRSGPMQSRR
jgi:hypothetical protein